MFGSDRLTLSKPIEIRTVAKSFTETMRKVPGTVSRPASSEKKAPLKPVTSSNRVPVTPVRQEVSDSNLDEIQVTMRTGYLKLEAVKPFAHNFLKQVNKLDEIKDYVDKDNTGEIIFSYSDSKGRWGKLENNGDKIKIACTKKQLSEFAEDQIDIYSMNEFNIQPSGLFFQVKGWGNLKELSIVNALKNSIAKLPSNSGIIYNYSLSSMAAIRDGGWECKVKITPGKIAK
jgi:hypothetical protein